MSRVSDMEIFRQDLKEQVELELLESGSPDKLASKVQVGGDHYKKHKIQPLDIIDEYKLGYYLGNVIKYVLRDKKDKKEDIDKAIHYLQLWKERVY